MRARGWLFVLALAYLLTKGAVNLKAGVVWKPSRGLAAALPLIEREYRRLFGRSYVVTSGNDGEHMEGSLHYRARSGVAGEHDAMDVRTNDLTLAQEDALGAALAAALGPDYDVVWIPYRATARHMHIEYDPR